MNRKGWIHSSANTFPNKVWVIVKGRSADEPDKSRLIQKANISYHTEEAPPRTFEEALFKEHPDIAKDMKKLVEKLAEFDTYDPNPRMVSTFYNMWKDAKARRSGQNRTRGSRFVRNFASSDVAIANGTGDAMETGSMPADLPGVVSVISDNNSL